MLEKLGFFAAGVAVGMAATYIFLKKNIEQAANDRADEEIESLKKRYKIEIVPVNTDDESSNESPNEVTDTENEEQLTNDIDDYPREGRCQPYIISMTEFDTNPDEYQQLTLVYHEMDHVLEDEHGEVIDIDAHIGCDNLGHWGEKADRKDRMYIRNDSLMCDFVVDREMDAYGAFPDDED